MEKIVIKEVKKSKPCNHCGRETNIRIRLVSRGKRFNGYLCDDCLGEMLKGVFPEYDN